MSGEGILRKIADCRAGRIRVEGHSLGVRVPEERKVPLVPFGADPFIICEIKRSSPSRGDIDATLDPAAQAGRYVAAGVRSVSVLTEEDHFSGSLRDLMMVKEAFPGLSVLRKEFILDEEDLEVSYRAGADAVLLIAALLDKDTLKRLYFRARELGLEPLVEVHDADDVARAREFRPRLTGINSRDLKTFRVDPLLPFSVAGRIDWETRLVYESGIAHAENVRLSLSSGFSGVLVGETVVRHPERLPELVAAAGAAPEAARFWTALARKRDEHPSRPLVKICGITCREDAELADALGADLLGFVFADSPRRADPDFVAKLGPTGALKVGVVVAGDGGLPPEVRSLLASGRLDAVQFHGDEAPEECARLAFFYPYYKAVRVGSAGDLAETAAYRSPRVLIDARVPEVRGGSGIAVERSLAQQAAESGPLWLAGGIGPHNAADIVADLAPELIDLSSSLEMEPGRKDPAQLRRLFAVLNGDGVTE